LHLSIVRPETLLKWQRQFIKKKWTFNNRKKGRPYIKKEIKDLILEMKQDNLFWAWVSFLHPGLKTVVM